MKHTYLFILINSFLIISCENKKKISSLTFNQYWQQQGAEISTYQITNNRYGQQRTGKIIDIFVTESFNLNTHVKAESVQSQQIATPILKLNRITRFTTGIYDYSLMTSTFSSYDKKNNFIDTLKTTTSIQDWCGQVFIQANRQSKLNTYAIKSFSYFENVADQNIGTSKDVILENSLWTWIRLSPQTLPKKQITILPSNEFLRLNHLPYQPYTANLSFQTIDNGLQILTLKYKKLRRTVQITFLKEFPYSIHSWSEETQLDSGNKIKITAKLLSRVHNPYWQKNKKKDIHLRKKIKISPTLF